MPITINFVSSYADAYDLTNPSELKKVKRMLNAKKRFGRPSNGKQTKLVKFGYKGFDFLTK